MAPAGRKQLASNAAVAVALVAAAMLLVAAAAADGACGVSSDTMGKCLSYCKSGANEDACCAPLRSANFDCLCHNYWSTLQRMPGDAKQCAAKIKSDCGITHSC